MEIAASGNKNRVLPAWMTAQVTESVRPTKSPKRRRTAVARTASAARLPATRTVYCLNEAELVDVALGILIEVKSTVDFLPPCLPLHPAVLRVGNPHIFIQLKAVKESMCRLQGHKQEELWEQQVLAGSDKLELSPNHSRSPWSPGGQSDVDDNGEDALPVSHGPSQGLGRADPVCSQSQEEEEDALKYVREIFFN
ncbi:PREDICTED: modulator of retrovirus infection homolog [Chrysochloris asiatica]|uniref:Modulator of retrovirus infection homolog n=1 Tax=Chrysochloris asiatica TaxID=185453 RepID=A0A9B0TIE6_CHRAS|nr:PREDICTED: modulator of retrovirus infection homolog [Chrysochloris asiatica]